MRILAQKPNLIKSITHRVPDIVTQNPHTFFYSLEEGIELNLTSTEMSSVLNKDGIVKVAGKIIQYSKFNIKIIEDGDPTKIALLDKINQTDKSQGITVNPINFKSSGQKNSKVSKVAYSYTRSCENATGSPLQYRVIVYEEAYDFNDGVLRYWVGNYRVRTLRRGAFGAWYNHATRSQNGSVNFTPSFSQPIGGLSWATTPYMTPNGSYSFDNSSGSETSNYGINFFDYAVNLTAGLNPPYNSLEIRFSSSTTATFNFGTGGSGCTCSI
ncbi:hypothetical protein [Runella slithyformis]|uniref:Uncharacterized protein n=1 Tax=Runella slithyformis (strain ATCC 29530 / DSM 19594 / LMG 11500 / NCIMB 11436 / LSU 4) TaxID=761193 RepID=A0A7U3ZJR8_RUNSL|nr:hypothetical protein [Runella slithyformis]AEI48526.1 hypothetical protein Runsl_2112 [Runella slithyformis DSM 19594]